MATALKLLGTGIVMGIVHVLTGPDHMSVSPKAILLKSSLLDSLPLFCFSVDCLLILILYGAI